MAVIVMGRLTPLIGVMLLVLTGLASTAHADARSDAKEQVRFGIRVAQRGLWQEALYRWKRATEIDPSYAEAFNNLAIAHENQGQLEEAREAYERAIELAPDNAMILQNYDLFKEINERANRRQS
jgi:Tfp pilus assembly protein PilF